MKAVQAFKKLNAACETLTTSSCRQLKAWASDTQQYWMHRLCRNLSRYRRERERERARKKERESRERERAEISTVTGSNVTLIPYWNWFSDRGIVIPSKENVVLWEMCRRKRSMYGQLDQEMGVACFISFLLE